MVDAQAGDLGRANTLARELAAKSLQASALQLYAIALARGITEGPDGANRLLFVSLNAARVPPSILTTTREAWLEIATFAAIDNDRAQAQEVFNNLPHISDPTMFEVALADVLASLVLGNREVLQKFAAQSPFPAIRTAAAAALAELAGDAKSAADGWQNVSAADGFGRFHIALAVHLARAQHALGDSAAAQATCESAIHPTLFHWSWAAALVECKKLSEDHTQP
jgi:hypothetical protein